MVNTDALQQVIERINQMVTEGEITPEEGQRKIAYARSQAEQASEEAEEETDEIVESEEGEVEDAEEEIVEDEEVEEEDVEEVEEDEEDEEVDTETEEIIDEDSDVDAFLDDKNISKNRKRKKVKELLEKGGGINNFDINNLSRREKKVFEKLTGNVTAGEYSGKVTEGGDIFTLANGNLEKISIQDKQYNAQEFVDDIRNGKGFFTQLLNNKNRIPFQVEDPDNPNRKIDVFKDGKINQQLSDDQIIDITKDLYGEVFAKLKPQVLDAVNLGIIDNAFQFTVAGKRYDMPWSYKFSDGRILSEEQINDGYVVLDDKAIKVAENKQGVRDIIEKKEIEIIVNNGNENDSTSTNDLMTIDEVFNSVLTNANNSNLTTLTEEDVLVVPWENRETRQPLGAEQMTGGGLAIGTSGRRMQVFDIEDPLKFAEVRSKLMQSFFKNNDYIQGKIKIINEDLLDPGTELYRTITSELTALQDFYGINNSCINAETGEIDKENCMGGDIDNYYKFFQAGSQLQGSLIMKELAKDPLYTKVINEVEQKFNQRLEHDAKELGVSKYSMGWQFAIDWPFTDTWSLGRGAEKTLRDIANKKSKKDVLNDLDRQNNFKKAFTDALEIQYHDPKLIHAAKNGLPITEEMLIESKNAGYKEPTPDNEKVCIAEGVFESFMRTGRSAGAKSKNMTAYKSAPTIIPCGEKGREIWQNDTGVPSDHAKYSTMTFKEYKDMMKESIVINNLSALEDFKEIFKEEKVIQDLTEFDYDKLSLVPSAEIGNLLTEQGPQMVYSIVTLGFGPGITQAQETYFNLVEKQALKKSKAYGRDWNSLSEQEKIKLRMEILEDEKLMNKISFNSNLTGTAYGGLEAVPWLKGLKVLHQPIKSVGSAIMKKNYKQALNNALLNGTKVNAVALTESITEVLQDMVVANTEDKETNLFESGFTGYVAGLYTMGGASISKASIQNITDISKYISSNLRTNEDAQAYLNAQLEEAYKFIDGDEYNNYSEQEKKEYNDKVQAIKEVKAGWDGMNESIADPELREEALELLIEKNRLEKKSKNTDPSLNEKNEIEIENTKLKLKGINKAALVRDAIREGELAYEVLFDNPELKNIIQRVDPNDTAKIDQLIKEGWKEKDFDSEGTDAKILFKGDEMIVLADPKKILSSFRKGGLDHEFIGHALLRKTFESNPEVAKTLATSILDLIAKTDPKVLKDSNFQRRLNKYGYIDENGEFKPSQKAKDMKYKAKDYYEEVIALFAEGLREGEISGKTALDKIGDLYENTIGALLLKLGVFDEKQAEKLEFNTAEDVRDFIINTQKAVDKGETTSQMFQALKGTITGDLINDLIKNEESKLNSKGEVDNKTAKAAIGDKKISLDAQNEVEAYLDIINNTAEDTEGLNVKPAFITNAENKIIDLISPTVNAIAENRAKALYDPIPSNLKAGVTRDEFKQLLINDMNLMVVNEFDPAKQDLEKFIVNRGFLRAMSAAKRSGIQEQFTVDITGVNEGETDTASWADPDADEVLTTKKISPTKMLGEDLSKLTVENVRQRIKDQNIDINDLTYRKVNLLGLATEEVAAYFNVPTEFLAIKGKNLNTEVARSARMIINRDADKLLSLMPEGFSQELGISTGIPNTLLNKFYTKGERQGNLVPWTLRKDISRSEFLAAFGIKADGTFNPKADGQIIKALMQVVNSNVSNEIIGNMPGITDQGRFYLKTGGSKSLAALSVELKDLGERFGIEDLAEGIQYNTVMDLTTMLRSETEDNPFQFISPQQTIDLMSEFNNTPDKDIDVFLKKYPKSGYIIKDYYEALMANKTEEGKQKSANFKNALKNEIIPNLADIDPNIALGLENGTWKLSAEDFRNDPDAQKNYMAQNVDMAFGIPINTDFLSKNTRLMLGMLGSYGANRVVGNENANLKVGKDGRPPAKYMTALTKAFTTEFKTYEDYKKSKYGYLSEENYNRWKNLDYKALSTTYDYNFKKAFKSLSDPDLTLDERKKIILDNFSSEGGKAQLEFLSLQISSMQDYLYAADPGSPEFTTRANHVLKLLSTSSQLTSGVRLYADPNYFYMPEKGEEGTVKFEHLMSANEFNKNIASLVLSNQWGKTEKSADVLSQYNGIYGYKDKFDIIDQQGKTNTSLIFRMGRNLEIAKNTYTLSSGLKETVYDEMKRTIGEEALRDFERDAEAIYDHNNSVINKNGLAALTTDTTGYEYSTNELQVEVMSDMDNTVRIASDPEAEKKGITVADFDDTVALSNSKVVYTLPDGTTGELNASDFAKQYGSLQEQGAEFNFDQFNEVVDGKPGPMLQRIKDIAEKYGTSEVYILTARDPKAAEAIQLFLKAQGLDLPIENIVGLADGTAAAKGRWVLDKTGQGYNDWYFTDDQIKNVDEVKRILDIADVKSDVQLSKAALSDDEINVTFNRFLETSTGIGAQKTFSEAKGKLMGKKASRKFLDVIMPYSAEDFKGLLYTTLASGQEGEAQFDFYKKHLIDPYNKAVSETNMNMVSMSNDYRALKKQFKNVPKTLNEQSGISGYTIGDAMRVYMWSEAGYDIPGLSKTDQKRLNEFVMENADLVGFSQGIITLQKNRGYPEPGEHWVSGNVATDIIGGINSINRSESLTQWQNNVDVIFSKENMSKLEAAYGPSYVSALKSTLARMKSGKNRLPSGNPVTDNVLDWINNSVGNVMFLNTRSAALQTLSSVNFINWGDNNVVAAGKAFANQKQYWSDFMTLMNSDYLVQRRDGLKINVTESEIADAVKDSKNKFKAATAYMLNKGFVFTRYADSFAIASGGATFYRNRLNTYLKEGFSETEAQQKAFDDFYEISEETQQSADPSKISQQQSSNAGRIILAFANTPMQYGRLQKRAAQDLMNGRGDWKTNVSKLAYYGVAQNIMFNSLQQALFTEMFEGDDDELEEKGNKMFNLINGMTSSNLRGLGITGAAADALKNTLITIAEESGKRSPQFDKAISDLFDIAPPIDSKLRKLQSAANTFSWNRKEMKEIGVDVDNPALLASAQVISAMANIPMDRALMKLNNLRNAMSDQSDNWQKVALLLGYSSWELGLPYYGVESKDEKADKEAAYEKRKEKYQIEIKKLKKDGYKKVRKKVEGAITVQRPTEFAKSPTIEYWIKK